jgi:capsular exopolysaccharide synthesis family protein
LAAADPNITTQTELLSSATTRNRAVAAVYSRPQPEPLGKGEFADPLTGLREMIGLSQPIESVPWGQAVSMASSTLQVTNARNSRILSIQSESPNPQAAAEFVNTLAEEYILRSQEERWAAYEDTAGWLARAEEGLKADVEESEEALAEFARASGLLFLGETTSVTEERVRQLQSELSEAIGGRIQLEAVYESSLSSPTEALPEVLDSGPMGQYQLRLSELRRELAELGTTLTPAHYRVQQLQAQIVALETVRADESTNIIRRIEIEYQAALRREEQLRRDYEQEKALLSDQAGTLIQYNILKREIETNKALYDMTLQQGREASIASGMRPVSVRVVDPARVPFAPRRPSLPINLALGMIGGLGCGAGFVVLRSKSDTRIRVLDSLNAHTDLRELGVIPSAKIDPDVKILTRRPSDPDSVVGSLLLRVTGECTNPEESLELVTARRKESVLAEAFRATMASILVARDGNQGPRVLVFTSPLPQEGKSAVVSNLGIALAEINQRVLIIDGDLRRPRMHTTFQLPNTYGLSDLLHQREPLDREGGEAFARKTAMPGLYVLPAGPARTSLSRLLHSPRLTELIERCRGEFDTVLIDTPPVLSVSDSRVFAQVADAVIMVLRANRTSQDAGLAALRLFVEDGTPILGTILNDWNPKISGYESSYYGAYRSYYYSGQGGSS